MTGKRDCNHTLVRAENGFMLAFLYRPSSHSIFATPPATLKCKVVNNSKIGTVALVSKAIQAGQLSSKVVPVISTLYLLHIIFFSFK